MVLLASLLRELPQRFAIVDRTQIANWMRLRRQLIIDKVEERAATKAQKQIAFETGNPEVEVKLVNAAIVRYSY